jgi:UDPglucose 6-dehydrogenase
MEQLWAAGARVRAFDPEARAETTRIYGERPDLTLCEDAYEALDGADVLAIVTEWKAFRAPDFARIRGALKDPAIFDGRNLYDPAQVEEAGLAYYGIGRGRSLASVPVPSAAVLRPAATA